MYSCNQLLQALKDGECDASLSLVYTTAGLSQAKARALHVAQSLADIFAPKQNAARSLAAITRIISTAMYSVPA